MFRFTHILFDSSKNLQLKKYEATTFMSHHCWWQLWYYNSLWYSNYNTTSSICIARISVVINCNTLKLQLRGICVIFITSFWCNPPTLLQNLVKPMMIQRWQGWFKKHLNYFNQSWQNKYFDRKKERMRSERAIYHRAICSDIHVVHLRASMHGRQKWGVGAWHSLLQMWYQINTTYIYFWKHLKCPKLFLLNRLFLHLGTSVIPSDPATTAPPT